MGFMEFMKHGGVPLYVNLIVMAATILIIIERTIRLYSTYNINGRGFLEQIEKLILANNLERAIKQCNGVQTAILPKIIKSGLLAAHKGRAAVTQALEESMLSWLPLIHARVQTLWSLANIATLVGLIGTIFGLITAFQAIALATPEEKTKILTMGIAEAMYNTAFGLTIAVANIIAHMFLHGQAKHMSEDIELASVRMENLLSSRTFTLSENSEEAASR